MRKKHRNKALAILYILFSIILMTQTATAFTVSGIVRDPSLNPVSNVDVFLFDGGGNPISIPLTFTNIDGFYEIINLPSGSYFLDFEPSTSSHLLATREPLTISGANAILDVNLELGYYLSGYVTDSMGVGLFEVDLNVYDQLTGIQLNTPGDNTDETGFYDVVVPAGVFRLLYRSIAGARLVPVQITNVTINSDTTIDATMYSGFYVSGVVTGPGGVPVADADLDADNSITGIRVYTPGDNTNSNGEYQLLLPGGIFNINVTPDPIEHLVPGMEFSFIVNSDVTLNFSLESGYIITGLVTNPDGLPVEDVDLDCYDISTGLKRITPSDNTDENGIYQIVLPSGTYDIDFKPPAVPPYLAPVRAYNIAINNDIVYNITLSSGVLLSGNITSASGAPIADIDIDAYNILFGEYSPLSGDYTDSLGNFSTVIAPGAYDIEIEPPFIRHLEDILIENLNLYNDTSITVVLDTGMVVSGTVYNSSGGYLNDVYIIATNSTGGDTVFTTGNKTDSLGFYQIHLSPGSYDLLYKPDSLWGIPDTMFLENTNIGQDTVINVTFPPTSPDNEPPVAIVNSPNGGENWPAYSQQTILWTAVDNVWVTSVDLYYSTTGPGGTYSPIASGQPNDGSYQWLVPLQLSDNAYIKIVAFDAAQNSGDDVSDAAFSIYTSSSGCDYVPGDVNSSGGANGLDVVFMVNYFKGGETPIYICECTTGDTWFVAGDVNASCSLNGLDVTYMVGFLKGGPPLTPCSDCPPSQIMTELKGQSR